jgi:hypothetical protein
LTLLLVPIVLFVTWAERPLLHLPAALGPPGPWSPWLLALGLAASMIGLTRLAIAGFAPDGRPPVLVLAAFAVGMACIFLTGRAPPQASTLSAGRPVAGAYDT